MLSKAILKLNEQQADDPEILIRGYGKVRLSQAKQRVNDVLQQALKSSSMQLHKSLTNQLFNGTLEAFVAAINDAERGEEDMQ